MIDLMAPAPGFDTPLAMLSACHRRIERRLEQLGHVVDRLAEPDAARHPEALRVLADVRRHFATSGAHHTDDEELTLFPMLREDPKLRELIDRLEADHEEIAAMERDLDTLGDRLQAAVTPEDVDSLRTLAANLQAHYARHIRQEDEQILARAAQLLTPEQLAKLGFEMRRRRGA